MMLLARSILLDVQSMAPALRFQGSTCGSVQVHAGEPVDIFSEHFRMNGPQHAQWTAVSRKDLMAKIETK